MSGEITVEVTGENQVTIQYPGPAGVGVPPGGTTNQVLAKVSNTDYDTTWVTGGGGGGQVSVQFQDEGSNLGTSGTVDTVNFVGNGVVASRVGNTVTATITSGGGSGDVVGPASATDNAISRFDTTTGKLIQNSAATIDDSGNISATNLSGTNTGDVTLAAVGATPNANAASLSGQVLTLQPASASFPGVVTTGTQTIAGDKTFSGTTTLNGNLNLPETVNSSLAGANQRIPSHTQPGITFTNAGLTSIGSANNGGVTSGHTLQIFNETGASLTVVNEYASAAAGEKIYTGSGADIIILNHRSIWLQYNTTTAGWIVTESSNVVLSSSQVTGNLPVARLNSGTSASATTFWRGDASWSAITSSLISDFATTVRSTVLTGLSLATNQVIAATDTVLQAFGYLQKQITDLTTTVSGKAPLASPTFTGTVTLPAGQVVNGVTLTNAGSASNFLNAAGAYVSAGGGSSPLTTKGDVYTYSTVDTRLPVGSNGQVLSADSAEATGLKWTTVSGTGDVVGPASSVDSEVVLFNSTTGKLIKSATQTGRPKLTAGVLTASNIDLTSEVTGVLPNANGGKFTPIINNYTSSTTMADPGVGCSIIRVRAIGGGGGGGSGRKNATTAGRSGGSGGSAGAFVDVEFKYSDVPSWPVTITIGAGGAGAAGQTVDGSAGIAGTAGGDTTFDALVTAKGGLGGLGGGSVTIAGGRARAGSQTASLTPTANIVAAAGGQSGATAASITAGAGGFAGSGGGGGGLTTGNATMAGGDGGMNQKGGSVGVGGAAGSAGTNGADGDTTAPFISPFGSGGGGAGSSTTVALAGGNGGLYGAGGGGGSAGTNSVNDSGAGGNGAAGFMQVIAR